MQDFKSWRDFKNWLDQTSAALLLRFSNGDEHRARHLISAATLLAGFVLGCLAMALLRTLAMLVIVLAAVALGYGLRSFVSFRRRRYRRAR